MDKKAKVCPNCKKDLRNWFLRHPVLSIILVIIIIGVASSSSNSNEPATITTNNNTVSVVNAKVGDVIKTDKFEIIVTAIDEKSKVGTQYFNKTASEGATYIAVKLKYKNITTQPIGMFDQKPTLKLVGPNNVEYNNDLDASSNYATEVDPDSKIFSDLNPGITVNDATVFEISKTDYSKVGWKLKITADKTTEINIK